MPGADPARRVQPVEQTPTLGLCRQERPEHLGDVALRVGVPREGGGGDGDHARHLRIVPRGRPPGGVGRDRAVVAHLHRRGG